MKRQFGRYVISDDVADELGRGAFGRVYRAFDPNVNRYVAVKVLSSGSDPDLLSRFRDESKTAGKLEHENIVKVYDFDLQDGMPYLVMELLEGVTLESVIKSRMVFGRPIQLLDEVQIMFQVAAGLQYAHAQNVIHRDIKPGNIMVLPNGTAKVMDFGIARMMDKGGTRLTRQGDIAGTILYMAPEQFKGSDADKRTDIFSYADVYYELLTGQHPFFATDPGTVMYRITAHDPPPIRERLPECPALLEAMIQRLMSKDRELRPDKLEEVIFDTQPILQGLRQERAAVLVASIPALIEVDDQERARQAIRQVLELDPLNKVARHLRDQLLDEYRRKTIRTRVEVLAQEGEDHVAARRFSEAMQCFERAFALDKSDTSLRGRLDGVKLTLEKVRGAARLLSEARAELQQGRLEAALEKSQQASGLDQGNQEAIQFLSDVHRHIKDRRDADAIVRAKQHRGRGEYMDALAVLDGIEEGSAASIEAMLLRGMVERDSADAAIRHRRQLFDLALSDAREMLLSHRLDEAIVAAEALVAQYSEEPAAADFLCEVREHLAARGRMESVGKITQAARGFVKEERFADARSVIQQGLHSYPGDTSLTRLLQVAAALAAAQERADQISRIVEQTYSLAAERRLDEALLMIDRAIKQYGNEIALAERRRDLDLERARAEHAAGLQHTLEAARRLLAEERSGEAVELLEEAKFRFAGELDLAALLSEARTARAVEEERDFVSQTLSEVAALESVEQFETALSRVDAALAQYPAHADLLPAAERVRRKSQEQARRRMLTSRIGRIEAAIRSADWERASAECQDAALVFPSEEAFAQFPSKIQEARRQAEIELLKQRVQASLSRQDLESAERELASVPEAFSREAVWQHLRRDCQRLRQYLDSLALAENARSRNDFALAEQILVPLLADALDPRARNLLDEVIEARRAAEQHARRAEDLARRERDRVAIANGRVDAANLVRAADYQAALMLLDQLAAQYPGNEELRRDRETAKSDWDRQQREVEEQARRRREQAVAARRQTAAELMRNGDSQAAIALLDQLRVEYPEVLEIRSDLDALAREEERQRLEAEQAALRQREQAIAARRAKAAELLRNGDAPGAVALLDRLELEFPDVVEVRRDRKSALKEEKRQRREAEKRATLEQERAVIAEGRAQVAALARQGSHQEAAALLDQLATQHPGNPELQKDREAARRESERQRREAEELERRRREQSIAARRQQAAQSLQSGDAPAAIAILDQLYAQYPDVVEIRRDRAAAINEMERRRREAEEQARREREQTAIAERRAQAAILVRQGSYQSAVALLDQLAAEYPGDPEIHKDREAAWNAWEKLRNEAEQQARRERELADIVRGRSEAAGFMQQEDYQAAFALLDRLVLQFPGNHELEQDRKLAADALDRQHFEAEARARRALAAFSVHRREPGESTQPNPDVRKSVVKQLKPRQSEIARRTGESPAAFSARKPAETGRGIAEARIGSATGGRSTGGDASGYRTAGGSFSTFRGREMASEPASDSPLSRLYGPAGRAIMTARNAIAGFLGKGDRTVAVPLLDPCAATALAWIARRQPRDLELQTARDELLRRPGRSSASPERLIALISGIALVVLVSAYFACRPAAVRAQTPPPPVNSSQPSPVVPIR